MIETTPSIFIRRIRERIDALDEHLAEALLERRALAARIISKRTIAGGQARDSKRERWIHEQVTEHARSDQERRYLEAIFASVLAEAPLPVCPSKPLLAHGGAFRLPGSEPDGQPNTVRIGGARFGSGSLELIAGPCAVETEQQLLAAAHAARVAGALVLRGGAYKPRTCPRSFRGLGDVALPWLRSAADEHGLALVTEVLDPRQVDKVAEYADALQIGARNMHNAPLLEEAGATGLPVLVKRGLCATVDELLHALDYVRDGGSQEIVVCLRGLRTGSDASRFTLDLAAIAPIRRRGQVPVIVDPSHAAGSRELVGPLALAAVAAGADGLMIEVHPEPDGALCDGPQAVLPFTLSELMLTANAVHGAVSRDR